MDIHSDWQSGKSLVESNKFMFDNELTTDVTFIFPGNEGKIKAHKFILMSRSHVFFVMFSSSLTDPSKDVEIKDIDMDVFKDFLRFLYGVDVTPSADDAFHLLYCAKKYEVWGLHAKAVTSLIQGLSPQTVVAVLDQAVLYDEPRLVDRCLQYLVYDAPKQLGELLLATHVSRDTLLALVDCDILEVDETTLFEVCDSWAAVECERRQLEATRDNRRHVLGAALGKIRFCSMSTNQVASKVSPCGLLTAQEELAIFRFTAMAGSDPEIAPFPHRKRRRPPLLYVMMPPAFTPNLDPVLSTRALTFSVTLTSEREFILLGFTFLKEGNLRVRVNGGEVDPLTVAEAGRPVYLDTPVWADPGRALLLESETSDVYHQLRARQPRVPYTIPCRPSWDAEHFTGLTVKVEGYEDSPLPFSAIILHF